MAHFPNLDYFYTNEEVCSSKTSVLSYQNTRRQSPQDQNTSAHLPENQHAYRYFSFVISRQNPDSSGVQGVRRGVGVGWITATDIARSYEIQGRNLMRLKR
jgi:hypothetical protein